MSEVKERFAKVRIDLSSIQRDRASIRTRLILRCLLKLRVTPRRKPTQYQINSKSIDNGNVAATTSTTNQVVEANKRYGVRVKS